MKALLLTTVFLISFLVMVQPNSVIMAATPTDSIDATCQSLSPEQRAANPACVTDSTDPITGSNGIIINIANLIAWFAGAIAVIMMIFAGFRLAKSSGDPGKVTQARETIIYSLVGLIVIVLARVIVGLVISKL
ncbi:MAG: pilin [Candidatus Saccharimonadales bacterium]